ERPWFFLPRAPVRLLRPRRLPGRGVSGSPRAPGLGLRRADEPRPSEPPRAEDGLSTADRRAPGKVRFLAAGQLRRKLSTINCRGGGGAQGSALPEREQGGSSHGADVVREAGSQRRSQRRSGDSPVAARREVWASPGRSPPSG